MRLVVVGHDILLADGDVPGLLKPLDQADPIGFGGVLAQKGPELECAISFSTRPTSSRLWLAPSRIVKFTDLAILVSVSTPFPRR